MDRVDAASEGKMLKDGRALLEWLSAYQGFVGPVEVNRVDAFMVEILTLF